MLSTDFTWLIVAVALVAAVFASFLAFGSYRRAKYCAEFVAQKNARSVSLKRLSEIEAEMTELTDSVVALQTSMKKLRSRIGMRHNRERGNGDGCPDPATDPEGYKRHMRQKLGIGMIKR